MLLNDTLILESEWMATDSPADPPEGGSKVESVPPGDLPRELGLGCTSGEKRGGKTKCRRNQAG